jgi:acyl-CoA synthetase (AMP-forming)/AMP-acid ligase II
VEAIQTHGVTISLGSPTIFKILGDYCQAHNVCLPSLKHVYLFGAAVPSRLVEQFSRLLPNGKVYTPFGATEALPLTCIGEDELVPETGPLTEQGAGVCVGRPLGDATIRIISIMDAPIPVWAESLVLPPGQIGEVVVKGSVVTHLYLNRPQKTAEAKIYEGETIWHRMGDLGYFDAQGRLWICGRKSHRVETAQGLLLTVQCEAIFNQHPAVKRTALVGLGAYGQQRPVLIVELDTAHKSANQQKVIEELLALGAKYEHTRTINTFLFHPAFPVDVRHNAKIQREKLTVWAGEQLS